jgi:hypothetical protein
MNREQALRRRNQPPTWQFSVGFVLSGSWHHPSVALPKMGDGLESLLEVS